MNRTFKIYLIILAAVIALLTFLEMNKTEIIDWRKTFDLNSKSPFGLYVFDQEVDHLFQQSLERTALTPYQYMEEDKDTVRRNYLFIDTDITPQGLEKLLEKVEQGDNAFFILRSYNNTLADEFNFNITYTRFLDDNILKLRDRKFAQDSLYIEKLSGNMALYKIDTISTRILGTSLNEADEPIANFIEVKYGKGNVYVHTEPMVLTNFYMLQHDDYTYAEHMFSYLPQYKTLWFLESDEIVNQSPLRYILSQKPLRYAWYLFLGSLVLFALFTAKRRQRIVPIIEPLKNSSAEFVQTIGNLYLQEGNYKDMASKKATYFLNRVRTDLLIDTHKLDEVFVRKLHLKTGVKQKTIEKAIPLLEKALHAQAPVQEKELIELNNLLDEILHNQ